MKNLKGGYKIIDLEFNDLSSGFTLEGLHEAITLAYEKPLLISNIVISGTKKNDIYSKATKSGTSYKIVVYGKELTVKNTDAVTIADYTEYDPNRVYLIDTENWGLSSSGTLAEAKLTKIKNNPNLVIKSASDNDTTYALCYFYPCGFNAFESLSYYKFYAINESSGSIKISILKVTKSSGAYTITTKTIS